MITDKGVEIVSKYLVGQASSYASYIAVGSGSRPTSNSQGVIVAVSGVTVGTVSGSGPYTATLTLSAGYWAYLQVGDTVTATAGTGSLGSGTVTVSAINSPQQITISSTATMTAGAGLTNIKIYSSLTSQSLSGKESLDFEVARFPISSRSYIVEKQTVTPSSLSIISPTQVTVTISSGHPFGIGDNVNIIGVAIPTSGPTNDIEVNGLYTITAISSTTFTAQVGPGAITNWDSSHYSTPYVGETYNNLLFNATVFTKQVSLTAEMLDTSRYEISELGLYSLGSNQYSASGNSRMLLNFESTEGWQHYNNDTTSFSDIQTLSPVALPIGTAPKFSSSTDAYWNTAYVKLRQEKPRIFNEGLIVPGALSSHDTGTTFTSTSDYLVLQDPGINLSKSSPSDEVRLAYSIMNAVNLPSALPTVVYIMFEFTCSDGENTAKLMFQDDGSGSTVAVPNRYRVLSRTMSQIITTAEFSWDNVTSVKVYCAIENSGATPSDDYAIVLDGLRFENVGAENPLYALTAYTVVNNTTATRITKSANSNDLINFRIDLAVGK